MDPSSSSSRAAASARRRRTWALYSEVIATVAIAVYALTFSVEGKPTPITIIERDPTLSYPYLSPATVPGEEMVMISILVPFGVFLLTGAAAWLRYGTGAKPLAVSVGYLMLALAQAILLTMAITDSIKVSVSFPRPNFFAYCNYKGYRDAIAGGNLTAYFDATTAGALGSQAFCTAPTKEVRDAQLSFPSGHASISFTAMTVAAMQLRYALGVPAGILVSVESVAAASPLIIAVWIAVTRVRDRFHNTVDVLCGALIGAIVGALVWGNHAAHRRPEVLPPALVPPPPAQPAGSKDEVAGLLPSTTTVVVAGGSGGAIRAAAAAGGSAASGGSTAGKGAAAAAVTTVVLQ